MKAINYDYYHLVGNSFHSPASSYKQALRNPDNMKDALMKQDYYTRKQMSKAANTLNLQPYQTFTKRPCDNQRDLKPWEYTRFKLLITAG